MKSRILGDNLEDIVYRKITVLVIFLSNGLIQSNQSNLYCEKLSWQNATKNSVVKKIEKEKNSSYEKGRYKLSKLRSKVLQNAEPLDKTDHTFDEMTSRTFRRYVKHNEGLEKTH